ncbi:oxysterol-binding protein-related protein 9-like [Ixodes scapularis]|uniref:oxysterol-binding protein-related protein 9-like n=1 Tax=Ixodes scapularis TaxID=6945 RepID=UPI001C38FEB7|nr:oxysterol-binding protein-related protein 9-like [Ixodes scapularis]
MLRLAESHANYSAPSVSNSTESTAQFFTADSRRNQRPSRQTESSNTLWETGAGSKSSGQSSPPSWHSEGSHSFKTSEESPDPATATRKRAPGPAQDLRELCSPLGFGVSMLKLDYPLPLLQPRSLLEAMTDLFACPELFVRIPASTRASERMLQVLRWYMAGIYCIKKDDGVTKPFYPILGEIFCCSWTMRRSDGPTDLVFFAEQVSVSSPVTCVYAEYRPSGISLMVQLRPEAFSVGSYLQLRARGKASLYLVEYAEEYDVELPAGCVRDVNGKPWFELCGTVTLSCRTTGFRAVIKFLAKPYQPEGHRHCVQIEVFNPVAPRPFLRIEGVWTECLIATWASGERDMFLDCRLLNEERRAPKPTSDSSMDSRRIWKDVKRALNKLNYDEAHRGMNLLATTTLDRYYEPLMFKRTGNGYAFKHDIRDERSDPTSVGH